MDNLITVLFIGIAIPMLLSLVLVDNKARLVLEFLLIGIGSAYFISMVNGLIAQCFNNQFLYITTNITPITEEIMKAFPVLFFACVFSDNRKQLMTISAAVGLGFAIMENVYIMANNVATATFAFALVRALGAGLMHGLCTAMVGYGISFVRKKRKLFYCGTFALLVTAITYHAIYNLLIQSSFRYVGICFPLVTYLVMILIMYRNKMIFAK